MTLHPELIVSVSGIRGIVGTSLTPDVAMQFAMAYGSPLAGKSVLVSRDGRPSGVPLGHAVIAGLTAVGCHVCDLGIAPTPTVGVAVSWQQAAGAIQITASHNPAPWNGLKMFGPDGAVLPAAQGAEIKSRFEEGRYQQSPWNRVGSLLAGSDAVGEHMKRVVQLVDVDRIREAKFTVLVDANGGSGGPAALRMLTMLGVSVVPLGCDPTGHFAHEAEPIPAHLVEVAPRVVTAKAAAGFVLDPDADRLALIDESGNCLSEEMTLALAVVQVLRQRTGPVVVNMSTSRMNEDVAKAAGCPFHRSAVGEANVVALMRRQHAVIGGEGNGGVIDPRVGWVRDPFVGMALILARLAEERKTLSALAAELPRYAMQKTKCTIERTALPALLTRIKSRWPGTAVNETDGLRLDGSDWWLHIRSSNTEPIVRIIAEAPSAEQTNLLCTDAMRILSAS